MIYYYELINFNTKEKMYLFQTNIKMPLFDRMSGANLMLLRDSIRVWCEDGDEVYTVKDRLSETIDLKEFMWIKLRAKEAFL